MTFWKKTGWVALGLAPLVIGLYWQVLASTLVMALYMVYQNIVTGNTVSYEQIAVDFTSGQPYSVLMVVVNLGYIVMFGLWYWFMFARREKNQSGRQVWKPQRIVGIVGCGIGVQLAISMLLTILLPLFPRIQENYMQIMNTLTGNDTVLMVICVCILAPISEELIFRGLMAGILRKVLPWQAALVIQAVLFGVYHLNLVQGIYATLLGLILGYTAYRYNSVIPGMLLHMAINSSSYLVSYLLPAEVENQLWMQLVFGTIGLVGTVLCSILYLKGVNPKSNSTSSD